MEQSNASLHPSDFVIVLRLYHVSLL